tara:strand:+ start:374 stop:616 length:243 start_codon:yes stop_codon:yes gene_type:complete
MLENILKELQNSIPTLFVLGFLYIVFTSGENYSSYSECMYHYDFEKTVTESMNPGGNDWKKIDKETHSHCLKWLQPWDYE